MLEQSFLDSIKADPNDELSRLAYADWLEEQGDPRADFLRAEAAHFRLGEESPHKVSGLASGIALDWLAQTSLTAVALRAVWQRVGKGFRSTATEEAGPSWEECEAKLREQFPGLVVPLDYALFQTLFPGGWFREGGRGTECAIWAGEMVRARTADWYRSLSGSVWLSIGVPWSDREEHFLCCIPSDPQFGQVVVTHDDAHVLEGYSSGHLPTFLAWLRSL